MNRFGKFIVWVLIGLALTAIFWPGFWRGDGLIGGDLYTYFYPQKLFYAERLAAGEFPLWNHWVGHGYPLVGESQTGAFYPPNYVAYRFLDVNTAYNGLQLAHYVLAFTFCVALGRSLNLSLPAAALAGLVYVYGWFPARISLEWAILGGAWLPAAFWCAEKLLATGRWRFAGGLALVLALQMLPGHFNLAFITQVTVLAYALGRTWLKPPELEPSSDQSAATPIRWRRLGLVGAALLLGFGLAAVQLVPSWELKSLSQRSNVGLHYQPGYGHVPVWYWTQLVAPFVWYGTGADLNAALPPGTPPTNAVEAHLYFGLIPVLLLLYGLWRGIFWRDRRWRLWGALGLLALIYTPGWLLPLTRHLPGFSFFQGPGRWGVVTTLAAGLLSAAALDELIARKSRWLSGLLVLGVLIGTTVDLWIVRGLVGDGIFVEQPPLSRRENSPIRERLLAFPEPVRLFCRGPNLPTLLGVSSTPVYLGLGPDQYFDPETKLPEPLPYDEPPTPEQIAWLQRAGVTHVLSFSPLDGFAWPVELAWSGDDPFLRTAWARGPHEPLFLYRFRGSRGRVAWANANPEATAQVQQLEANRVLVTADSPTGGRLILTDLAFPGWQVRVDGEPAESLTVEGTYRGVELPAGSHIVEWVYRPRSVRWGLGISALSGVVLMGMALAASTMKQPAGQMAGGARP